MANMRLAVILGISCLLAATVLFWHLSETLWKIHPVQDRSFTVSQTANLEEGKRKAKIAGCYTACHGNGGQGNDFYGYSAPNLTRLAKDYSDSDLERVVRQGIRPDGTSIYGMSSEMFQYMSDEDLGNIIAFLRSVPTENDAVSYRDMTAENFWRILTGETTPRASMISVEVPPKKVDPSDKMTFGRYLAQITCTECHGVDFKGLYGPNLIVVSAYEFDDFKKAVTRGLAMDDRQLELMHPIAESNFSNINEIELEALYAYLTSEPFIAKVSEETE